MMDESNLILSYTREDDLQLDKDGHAFLGVASDEYGDEVHVFLRKGHVLVGSNHPMGEIAK